MAASLKDNKGKEKDKDKKDKKPKINSLMDFITPENPETKDTDSQKKTKGNNKKSELPDPPEIPSEDEDDDDDSFEVASFLTPEEEEKYSGKNKGEQNKKNSGSGFCFSPPPDDRNNEFPVEKYLINYNKSFSDEQPIMFRDSVIHQTLSCLIGKFKPNALLIGAAGVGKTKIVEEIARRLESDDPLIPDQLKGYTIYELPLSNIVSGSGLVGDIEMKMKGVIKFATDPENKVILFIDEIHMLVNKGDRTYEKMAQLFKPSLARNDIHVIGATTLQEANELMSDPAFNRRFTRVIVDEITTEQTFMILKQLESSMTEHYKGLSVGEKTMREAIHIADEYRTSGSHRPDNAITLLDRAMADMYIDRVISGNSKNASKKEVYLSASRLKETAMKLLTGNAERTEVSPDSLRKSFDVIKGQDEAIEFIIDTIERDSLELYPRTKPLTLLFAGNSGVGKTEVVKILAKEIMDTKPIILNMTEYNSSASINRIIGSPSGYVGSDSKAELPFDILESNPYQVILLDEFEKADKSVQRLFMSAFDEGYIKTNRGKQVEFSKSIIIATTNAGYTTKSDSIGFTSGSRNSAQVSLSELRDSFDTELLNRFTKILHFKPITEECYREIIIDKYRRTVAELKKNRLDVEKLPDELDSKTVDELVKDTFVKEFGARPAERTVRKYIEDIMIQKKRKKSKKTQ